MLSRLNPPTIPSHLTPDDTIVDAFLVAFDPDDEEEDDLWNHTYQNVDGKYGHYPNVLFKKAMKTKRTPNGKTHAQLAINDLKHMQLLSESDNIARCFHSIMRPDFLLLVTEKYDFNLQDHITLKSGGSTMHKMVGGRNDARIIFSQLLKAVGFLHEKGIVHCNIQSKNVYCVTTGSTWRIKLGGLKYCRKWSSLLQPGANIGGPTDFEVARSTTFGMKEDRRRIAMIMYCYSKGEIPFTNIEATFTPDWTGEINYGYRALQLKHLCKLMMYQELQFPCISYLDHPLFMSIEEMVSLQDRMRMVLKNDLIAQQHLESFAEYVFRTNWQTQIPPDVLKWLLRYSPKMIFSLVALLIAIRNRRQHRGEDPKWVQDALGPVHVENFMFWEKKLPSFFLCLFIAMGTLKHNGAYLCETPKFSKSSFFKSDPDFFKACKAVTVYETLPLPPFPLA